MKKSRNKKSDINQQIIQTVSAYKREAESARLSRMQQNQQNYDTYHLKQDFSHKNPGQSKEFLAKQAMAVEQLSNFVQQGLADLGDEWFSVEREDGNEIAKIKPEEVKSILYRQLTKANIYDCVSDMLKSGMLGSLMIVKVHTKEVCKPHFVVRKKRVMRKEVPSLYRVDKKVAQLELGIVSPRDYYPDPTGRELYEIEHIEEDLHVIKAMVKSEKNPNGIYDEEVVAQLTADMAAKAEDEASKSRETGQNVAQSSYRKRVQLDECWGTILDADGEVLFENVVCTIANDKYLIRAPEENPFWHNQSPYVVAPLVRVPKSVWHKALMDAPTKHNIALNEIYNLALDNGIMAVYGVKQLRQDWLEDPSQVDEGVKPGQTLLVSGNCPPNGKVVERVDTANMAPEAIQMFQLTTGEFQQSALTNDIRLGVLPQRAVKATEIVAAEQSVTGMLNGLAKQIENAAIAKILNKGWMVCAQHLDDFDSDEMKKLLGANRAAIINSLTPQERFAETVNGMTFTVYGLTYTLNKAKDFRKIGTLMQTLASAPILAQAFAKEYDFSKLLRTVMKSLDIDPDQLKLDELEKQENAIAALSGGAQGSAQAGGPDKMSQVPQAGSDRSNLGPETTSAIAQPQFPPSRATGALKQ